MIDGNNDLPEVDFGEMILRYRTRLGLSQAEFGRMFGLSQAAISKHEIGNTGKKTKAILKMAFYLIGTGGSQIE